MICTLWIKKFRDIIHAFSCFFKYSARQVPDEVKSSSIEHWKYHLVGFFLDGNLSYCAVLIHLQKNFNEIDSEIEDRENCIIMA